METSAYWSQYNLLRRHAQSWNIDYTRYTHAQLEHAIELNNGVVDAGLRARLSVMPPVNAYHAAIRSGKEEMHKLRHDNVIQKAHPLIESQLFYSSYEKKSPATTPLFTLPAPKESFPWASVSL